MLIEQAFHDQGHRLRVTMQLPGTRRSRRRSSPTWPWPWCPATPCPGSWRSGCWPGSRSTGWCSSGPIHILHRKGKHLSPLARRFLTFAQEYVAKERHLTPPVLLPRAAGGTFVNTQVNKQIGGGTPKTLI